MRFKFNNSKLKFARRKLRNEMTQAEVLLWDRIKNNQILGYKFRREYSVGPFILDFYCTKLRLAIELDGGQHADEKQEEYDKGRTNYLNDHNIQVIRYWNNDVIENMDSVYFDILNRVNSR